MGEYWTNVRIDFKGSEKETKQLEKLLELMDKEFGKEYWLKRDSRYEISDIFQNALLGILEDRGENSNYHCRFCPDFQLGKAPKLIAALFPEAEFSFSADYEYSCGGGITMFNADYKRKILKAKECEEGWDEELLTDEERDAWENDELVADEYLDIICQRKKASVIEPEYDQNYIQSFFSEEDLRQYLEANC